MGIPTVEKMEIYPVAGHDCMELNLSGAHAPYFTRNIVIPMVWKAWARCPAVRRSPRRWRM